MVARAASARIRSPDAHLSSAAVGAAALALALPAAAQAGTVAEINGVNTYTGSPAERDRDRSATTPARWSSSRRRSGSAGSAPCTPNRGDRIDCDTTATTAVNAADGDDRVDASMFERDEPAWSTAACGGDYLLDGAGNDTINGGPGGDVNIAGRGTDVFNGGDGDDTADYSGRGHAGDDHAQRPARRRRGGRGRHVGADVEGAFGGAGNDAIVGNGLGNRLIGNGGNDRSPAARARTASRAARATTRSTRATAASTRSTAARAPTRCSPTPATSPRNCEIAPDRDGDGTLNEQDCAPDNAAVHPGAGEIVGNAVDEDCAGGPQYLRVSASLSYSTARRGDSAKFTKLASTRSRPATRSRSAAPAARARAARSPRRPRPARPARRRSTCCR